MDKVDSRAAEQNTEAAGFSDRFMQAGGTSAASPAGGVSGPVPEVSESVSYGEDQGGLIDWFKRLFGGSSSSSSASSGTSGSQSSTDSSSDEEQADTGSEGGGEDSLWDDTNDPEEYITDVPNDVTGRDILRIEHDYSGELKKRPVFETHSFMPRDSIDGENHGLHSFMGLRYTKIDPKTGRLVRKRVKMGFGGTSQRWYRSTGRFIDDFNTQADMSSETAIPMDNLRAVVDSVDEVSNNIDASKKGQAQGAGLSGTYNLFTNNCNDFVQYMARIAGAEVPAALHESILGPGGAYKNLANAAEYGQQGETKFFQGGGKLQGQMSADVVENGVVVKQGGRNNFLMNYRAEAERALGVDGIKLSDSPELSRLINNLVVSAAYVGSYLSGAASAPETEGEKKALELSLDKVSQDVRAVVEFHYKVKHPRLNISAMKIESLAEDVRSTYLPQARRGPADLTDIELDYALGATSTAESSATGQVESKALFNQDNIASIREEGALAARLILDVVGIDNPKAFVDRLVGDNGVVEKTPEVLESLMAAFRQSGDSLIPYLTRYAGARPGTTAMQNAQTMTLGILKLLGLNAMYFTQMSLMENSNRETGEIEPQTEADRSKVERMRNGYVNPRRIDLTAQPERQGEIDVRQRHMDLTDEVRDFLKEKFESIEEEAE